MNQRKCSQCGAMVDSAKAFCPECRNSMDFEEERKVATEFDAHAGTIQFSETAFGMILEEMDLQIPASKPKISIASDEIPPQAPPVIAVGEKSKFNYYLMVGLVIALLMALIVVCAGLLFVIYSR